ncbi:TetR/AcrR family transcriptional regulator [Streptomyces atroolivaceus]|uniref:TetR/AcrR family transcriptional regulator n=1 Tax=Streptomyces atroolivaceus TaxID=66869 RepID=A0ABV9VJR2_STRAZ|nr:TetR/AcrR family transcriptional regulator [Streptomyces atroolivaceus]
MTPERKARAPQPTSVELLWGAKNKPTRGPRPGLSLEIIAATAIEIADEVGLEGLSMQAVASRLDYTAMSLYRYVPGKEQLVDVIYDTALGLPRPATGSEDWRAGVHGWVWAMLGVYKEHPWLLRITTNSPPLGPNQLAWFEALLHHVSGIGLDEEEVVHLVIFVTCAVRDLARTSSDLAQGPQQSGVPVEEMAQEYALAMKHLVGEDHFPALSKMVAAGTFEPDETQYNDIMPSLEFGLQRLLDGVDGYISARGR